ncbi:MAG: FAD/NAD(P)-binding protein [Acidobacteriota bacterium]|nr:FAD/NAD(P)-binding protein [Acidobacteriota bacterium]
MNPEWLICGGGIHGVHLASRLIGEAGIPLKRIRIIDPGERLLARWRACTRATGMTHLRSPSVHHLGLESFSLQRFAERSRREISRPFMAPYQRPSLELFDAHCEKLIADRGLETIHIRDKITRCEAYQDGIELTTKTGRKLSAMKIILAIGIGDQPAWPEDVPGCHSMVQHIFDPSFTWPSLKPSEPVLVIGGGISAGQVALRLVGEGHLVHVVSRHVMRIHQFDSDPGWLDPKNMQGFSKETCMARRRGKILAARHRGSMPGDVREALLHHIRRGRLYWHRAEVDAWSFSNEQVSLKLSEEVTLNGQHVLLATGFSASRPGGSLVEGMISEMDLPLAPCGFLLVDHMLRWHPHIFLSGALAELELGPVARNIAGARLAGDRIVDFLRFQSRGVKSA